MLFHTMPIEVTQRFGNLHRYPTVQNPIEAQARPENVGAVIDASDNLWRVNDDTKTKLLHAAQISGSQELGKLFARGGIRLVEALPLISDPDPKRPPIQLLTSTYLEIIPKKDTGEVEWRVISSPNSTRYEPNGAPVYHSSGVFQKDLVQRFIADELQSGDVDTVMDTLQRAMNDARDWGQYQFEQAIM